MARTQNSTKTLETIIDVSEQIAADKSIPVQERFVKAVLNLQVKDPNGQIMLQNLHTPQNALIHYKMENVILDRIAPLLAGIVREGVEQGIFSTRYPEEVMAMIWCYANNAFDMHRLTELSADRMVQKVDALIEAVERLTGAAQGSFGIIKQVFDRGGHGHE